MPSRFNAESAEEVPTMKSMVVAVIVWFIAAASGQAHPYHVSSAEMEFNAQSGRYEVALKLSAADFQQQLTYLNAAKAREKLTIDESEPHELSATLPDELTPGDKRLLQEYLSSHFFITCGRTSELPTKEKLSKLTWIGCELERNTVWLYFELQPPVGEEPLFLTNKVLMDLNKYQTNTVVVVSPVGRASLKTHEPDSQVAIPPHK